MCKTFLTGLALFFIQAGAAEFDGKSRVFLEKHCYECHDEDVQKGNLDLTKLKFDLEDKEVYKKWIKVFDNVLLGDMPPKKKKKPEETELKSFLSSIEKALQAAGEKGQASNGRTRVRRMNRQEFQATLEDIFGLRLDIAADLPEDAKGDGFDTVGAALNVSSVQMEAYMDALDKVLDKATALYEKPARKKYELSLLHSHGIMQEYRKSNAYAVTEEGPVFFAPQKHSYLNPLLDHYVIPYDGDYKVSVFAKSMNTDKPLTLKVRLGGPGHAELDSIPKTLLGYADVYPEKMQEFKYESPLRLGQQFRIYPALLPYMRFTGKWEGNQHKFKGPGILVHKVVVDGPVLQEWPPKSHQLLWGGVKTAAKEKAKANLDPNAQLDKAPTQTAKPRMTKVKKDKETGNQFVYDPRQKAGGEKIYRRARMPKPYESTMDLVPDEPKADVKRLISRFVALAFRRETSVEETQAFIDLANFWLDEGASFEESMRAAYKAILTSPEFLYQKSAFEKPGNDGNQISDLALSERMSYFLWSSKPDRELLDLAKSGELRKKEVLFKQVERMLNDPKSERFLENFLGQWLDLRLMDFTSPDSKLYPEHDSVLQWSMEQEVYAFFRELLKNDLSVKNIIDSDFVTINDRLAKHYDLPPVKGTHMRKVTLPENSPRGGVLGMAAIHKVTANGTTTSPVVRGVWVLERIMGIHPPPPPPGVPAIEPDIRGAVSVLDQLHKHRSDKRCNSCHLLIDPPGVALENFDVIGKWRENYRALAEDKADDKIHYSPDGPPPIYYHKGKPVIASDSLKDGRQFTDINAFKKLLLEDPDKVARNVLEKLLTYSTGAGISFADRKEVMEIVADIKSKDYGFRTMIHEMVKSKIFQRK